MYGAWSEAATGSLTVSPDGTLQLSVFLGGGLASEDDWALKLKERIP